MKLFTAKEALPDHYVEAEKVDLVKNKKQMLLVNILAFVLAAVMVAIGFLIQPEGAAALFDLEENAWQSALQCLCILIGISAYVIGHEAVHGVFMWYYSRIKPNFGFSFTYAYAGSECYFAKGAYLTIALAPVVLWFVLLGMLNLLVPAHWFWVVWIIQVMNISGAAGDFYVFFHLLNKPQTMLVQDTGTAMTVFLPKA